MERIRSICDHEAAGAMQVQQNYMLLLLAVAATVDAVLYGDVSGFISLSAI